MAMKMETRYGRLEKRFRDALKKMFGRRVKVNLKYDGGGYAYVWVEYPLKQFLEFAFNIDSKNHPDIVIANVAKRIGITKYFRKSGSGTDFRTRDISFHEMKKCQKQRKRENRKESKQR